MTTAHSPPPVLRAQAEKIARLLKAAERGAALGADAAGKLAKARTTETVTFAVVMDDKLLKITMPWATIRQNSEAELIQFVLAEMAKEAAAAPKPGILGPAQGNA